MPILEESWQTRLLNDALGVVETHPILSGVTVVILALVVTALIPKSWGRAEAGEESEHRDRQS